MVDKQLKERTELTHSSIGAPQRESILAAGLALQQAGVIKADVDVKATVDALIDDRGRGDELGTRVTLRPTLSDSLLEGRATSECS